MNNRLGCFSTTAFITAVITGFILASVAFASGASMFSPGNLNAVPGKAIGGVLSHEQIGSQCAQCHTPFWEKGRMADRCVVCHTDIAKQLINPLTLHGFLRESDPNMDCIDCHTEHHGAAAFLTAFRPSFPHQKLGYSLAAHPGVTCVECHNKNYLTFDQQSCTNCHRKRDTAFMTAHELAYGTNCLSCHDGIESRGAKFDHGKTLFPLTGSHLGVICTKCHLNARTLADMQNTPTLCFNCHAKVDPHGGRFGNSCESCHNVNSWKPAKFDHNLVSFKLIGKHADVACDACHKNNIFKGTPATCSGCHQKDDAHKGQFGSDCGTCHSPTGWKPATFDHNLAAFKLSGAHANVSCTQCHKNSDFKSIPTNCFACHAKDDHHNGAFGTNCGVCHSTIAWKPATFDHNLAAFKLTGAHVNVSCAQCHKNNVFKGTPSSCFGCHSKDDNHGGAFGTNCGSCHSTTSWKNATFNHNVMSFQLTGAHASVSCASCHKNGVFKGTPSDCFSCHAKNDNHGGAFGTNCGSCHSTTSWKNATFNHNFSAFKLTGAHATVSCTSCHVNGVFKGTPSNCFACHAKNDNHGGSFGQNCGSCHSTASWKNATFDHNLSAFKLTGAHINVSCSSCHKNGVFKGTPSNCFACHSKDDNHGGSFGSNCGSCHSTTSWKNATFDHNLSAFKLTGAHINVSCTSCHVNGVFKGTPSNCFACHAKDDNHGGSFGQNCGSCHSTTNWKNAKFDHNLSAFKLTGAHVNVSCTSCHVNGVYKGTPSNCFACHAEPSFHSGAFGTNCAQCHSTSNWNATYTGPHPNNRDNGGIGHQGATCHDCHTQNVGSASCLKCHDSNNPGGNNRTATPQTSPTAGPSPTPRPTATPGPSATPRPTSTQGPSATPGPSSTPRPTRTPTATPTFGPSPTPRPTRTATATSQPPTATSQLPTATSQPPTATSQPPTSPPPTSPPPTSPPPTSPPPTSPPPTSPPQPTPTP